MIGGLVVIAENVKKVAMIRDQTTGKYRGYDIEFEEGKAPYLFSLSIPDIVAVKTE
jgi:hypothetical protein